MNEKELLFAKEVWEKLNGLRVNEGIFIPGQVTFEQRWKGGEPIRIVVTNNNGQYEFEAAREIPAEKVNEEIAAMEQGIADEKGQA